MNLHGLAARLYAHVHLHLSLVALEQDILYGLDLQLSLLLVVLEAQPLPLVRETLFTKGFKIPKNYHCQELITLGLGHLGLLQGAGTHKGRLG